MNTLLNACRVCDSSRLELAIDLGHQPWCNHFLKEEELGKEPFYPLRVLYCHDCETAQLDYTVKKEIMFGDHTYLSGVTRSLNYHFQSIAEEADKRFFAGVPDKSILDIGSNDGSQLKQYQALGYEVTGVESSKTTARIANDAGVPTINSFFNQELARQLPRKFHLINASGVFFHLEELHSVTEGIRDCLRDDGVFIVQFLYMKKIVENLAFDQIYHEHLLYYNLKTIEILLQRHGLSMFDARLSPIHGGSIIGYVTHKPRATPSDRLKTMIAQEEQDSSNAFQTYRLFEKRIEQMKIENLAYLEKAKQAGKTIYGMGAPVKGNTMLNYFGAGKQYLDVLVEKNPLRKGLYAPGTHIPIVMEDELTRLPDIYFVLAWNFKDEILARNQHLIEQRIEFYFPVNP
ncbi:MAG: class I SAM-dependent methyltransferase [SAR324 cluster bacterium]|nr:class I SAM-dependent methyltransferase [SAR324 cluster bacterium]